MLCARRAVVAQVDLDLLVGTFFPPSYQTDRLMLLRRVYLVNLVVALVNTCKLMRTSGTGNMVTAGAMMSVRGSVSLLLALLKPYGYVYMIRRWCSYVVSSPLY